MKTNSEVKFISYSQNLEDVMLYRCLKQMKNGFYIDVGAQHPVEDSVTKAFYDLGWRGINVEPVPEYFQLLKDQRPDDININAIVGISQGETNFYEIIHTGLSTTNKAYAEKHSSAGYNVRLIRVPCTTLDSICADHGVDIVHFLKIDVEGQEAEVLSGFAFDRVRPWILVIEATEPNSSRSTWQEWESIVIGKEYHFVYFDGTNRFYVSNEHFELDPFFNCPPNVFDNFVTQRSILIEKNQIQMMNELTKVYNSRSWRLTAPLRRGNLIFNRFMSKLHL